MLSPAGGGLQLRLHASTAVYALTLPLQALCWSGRKLWCLGGSGLRPLSSSLALLACAS